MSAPDSFTIDETIYILAMVILGGTGNLWGSVLGAAILVILPELLKFIAAAGRHRRQVAPGRSTAWC